MKSNLTAKIQKLTSNTPEKATEFSYALAIDPGDPNILKKRGTLYCVYDISSSKEFDPLLINKMISDVLSDSYFQSENISPIQSMEKAIVNVRDNVISTTVDDTKRDLISGKFNIVVVALWGNVLYLVQYGDGGSFLMREGEIKPISVASEGNFSVASGIVRDDDAVMLGTQKFNDKYPPEELLSTGRVVSNYDLENLESSLMLKFAVDTSFSQDEVIHFMSDEVLDVSVKPKRSKRKLFGSGGRSSDQKALNDSNGAPVSSISDKKRLGISVLTSGKRKKPYLLLILLLVIGLLGFSIWYSLNANEEATVSSNVNSVVESARSILESASVLGVSTENTDTIISELEAAKNSLSALSQDNQEAKVLLDEINNKLVEITKIETINAEVFYDLALTDPDASPSDIVVLDGRIVVVDSSTGNVYSSFTSTPKFVIESSSFPEIRNLDYFGGDLSFIDDEGHKVYSFVSGEVLESNEFDESIEVASIYLDFIYEAEGREIIKYNKGLSGLEGEVWAADSVFEDAVSIAIDGSIYVLLSNGELLKYTSGVKDNFSIKGLDKGIDPISVLAYYDMENVYVLDKENRRLVVLDKEGNLIKQVINEDIEEWQDLRGFGISLDEKKAYLLDGTKIFEVDI